MESVVISKKFALIETKLTDSGKGNVYHIERNSASEKSAIRNHS